MTILCQCMTFKERNKWFLCSIAVRHSYCAGGVFCFFRGRCRAFWVHYSWFWNVWKVLTRVPNLMTFGACLVCEMFSGRRLMNCTCKQNTQIANFLLIFLAGVPWWLEHIPQICKVHFTSVIQRVSSLPKGSQQYELKTPSFRRLVPNTQLDQKSDVSDVTKTSPSKRGKCSKASVAKTSLF